MLLSGQEKIAELLLKNGAKVNAKSNTKATPLHLTVEGGKLYLLTFSLRHQISLVPLLFNSGHQKVARILLRNGANINAENSDKFTPLHLAAQQSMFDI